jgi:hypothetical protein
MTYTDSLVTIRSIIEGLFLTTELPEGYDAKMTQLAINGYRELNLVVLPGGRTIEKFTMDSNYIVYMNDDMTHINAVCVPLEGAMWPLTHLKDMVPTTSESGGSEILDPEDGEGVTIIERGTAYATRGGHNVYGYFYVDYQKRRILFRNTYRSEVLIDYMTSGISLTEETYVPTYAKAALEAYVRLYLEYNKGVPNPNSIAIFRDEYERQKAICRGIKFNIVDFMDGIYRTYRATVQRA